MSRVSRRRFLTGSLAAAGGTLVLNRTRVLGNVLGANERIRIGVAGINGRGGAHIGAFLGMKPGVEIAYLIDPDSRLFGKRVKAFTEAEQPEPQMVQDVRVALDDKDLDAIAIAAPNHWHALMTIWACQAGKDIYVEKPLSHNVREGRMAVEAAQRYNRIVQHGTQNRSDKGWIQAIAAIQSGKLGKLLVARGLCYKRRDSIGQKPPQSPPSEVDFNLWLGPAPDQPYHENLVHYNWHWFWDTGNGDIGNQGVHQMDVALWGIGGGLPRSVISVGGRFGYEDQAETANTQIAVMDYGNAQLIFEVRGLPTPEYRGSKIGNIFHCEAGDVIDKKFYPKGSSEPEPLPEVETRKGPGGGIFGNFIAAMRSRKTSDLDTNLPDSHHGCAIIHMANTSYRLGKKAPFSRRAKAFGDNTEAYETLARMGEHLATNGLNLDEINYRVGRKLTVNPQTEQVDDAEANALLAGTYRREFALPEKFA